ncbi:glycosyltransferase family 39 protein [Pseudohongiella spirulinae]|uniref:Glycosyltransferase RgtA/B/C/D-like domain-containing protein n=1 Tax=Pseudohongiella spirulinae TaxID=1249552 RepID=A0A0S2KDR4_9GAMM|nr:glycosyltransferase family 39 protein [Pseudohongiella spirulinae]ALO46455.1 hypothetical protein PS2015_1805 [Pseudohongiella spirulinae]
MMTNNAPTRNVLSPLPVAALLLLITSIKLMLAWRLELYSDEIFYWQASQFPALAYSDLPFMAALLAGLGSELLGNTPLAVRSLFLLMGSSLPLLIYWLALPLTGQRDALTSALLTLCLPMAAFLGLLAVPDVPMIFWGMLFLGMLERATRTGHSGYWLAAGVMAAMGLSSHYRFVLYPLAAVVYLLIATDHRHYWKSPGLWLGGLIGLCGFIPALSFNLMHDLSGLDYHLVDRHPWQFQAEGLMHPLIQAVIVTPLMYAALWYTLWRTFLQGREGDNRATLFMLFALFNLGVYLLLSPWSDTTRTTLHWPLSGYLPLLVFLPQTLRHIANQWSAKAAISTPLLGLLGTFLVLAGIGSQGFNQQLQTLVGNDVLSNKMAGWQPLAEKIEQLDQQHALPAERLYVTDNYYTAAQLSFKFPDLQVYTIDEDKTIRDGRATQYALWQRHTPALMQHDIDNIVFITEDSTLDIDEKTTVMQLACSLFQPLNFIDQLTLFNGDKRFSIYYGQKGYQTSLGSPCPLPALTWLDQPAEDVTLSGTVTISGWSIVPGFGAREIKVLLNRQSIATASRQIHREDVVQLMNGDSDPDAPVLGFEVLVDTTQFPNGRYELAIETVSGTGQLRLSGQRRISIRN